MHRPITRGVSSDTLLTNSLGDGSTLSLDFTTGVLDPRLTFTRASTATYINSQGYVTTMAAAPTNDPTKARFDYDPTTLAPRGLLVEGQTPTLNAYSEDYTNAYWTKVGSSVDTTTSVAGPDNVSTTTRRILESATTAQHGIRRGITTTAGTTYTVSVFVKPGSYDSFGFELFWSASYNAKAEVTSISGNTATVTSASGVNATLARTVLTASGWYRYALTFTHPAAVTGTITPDFNVFVKQTASYAGNGTNYMDVYGFMLETGSGASSYIPTGASTATRVQDQMEMADISALSYNLSVGTVALTAFWNKNASSAFPRSIRFVDASNVISSAIITTTDDLLGNWPLANGTTTLETTSANVPPIARFKYAMSASAVANPTLASLAVALNGTTGNVTGVASTVRPATKLQFLYGAGAATDYPSMTISSLKYWPTLMTSAQLQAMTTL